mgnify:CR=1 FL=1
MLAEHGLDGLSAELDLGVKLGKGAYGMVYQGWLRQPGQQGAAVAVKVVEDLGGSNSSDQVRHEVRMMRAASHKCNVALLAEFGMEWAPHKQRGPCAVIEFLGLLLCNVEGARCIALTESRQAKLRGMIDEWMARRPAAGERLQVAAKELANGMRWSARTTANMKVLHAHGRAAKGP